MLKPIPEELKKQGYRWVKVSDHDLMNWQNRILMHDLGELVESNRFICICETEDFLDGKKIKTFTPWGQMREIPQPQEPKKIPYTAETFPENAIWVRRVGKIERLKYEVNKNSYGSYVIRILDGKKTFFLNEDIEDYEIGCQIIKDGEIKIEWQKFYQIKE